MKLNDCPIDYINQLKEWIENQVFLTHIEHGGKYQIVGLCKMKEICDGSWNYAVIYSNNKEMFVREISSFIDNFEIIN